MEDIVNSIVYEFSNGYKLVKSEQLMIIDIVGKKRFVPTINNAIYLCKPYQPKTKKEAEELVKQKKIIKVFPKDLYKMTYKEEEFYKAFYGFSKRTKDYLDKIKTDLGFIESKMGYDSHIPKDSVLIESKEMSGLTGSGFIEIYKSADLYISEYTIRTDIDDYCIVDYFFRTKISFKDVSMITNILSIETSFKIGQVNEEFTCWECGGTTHWLDIAANNLLERIDFLEDRYCGC